MRLLLSCFHVQSEAWYLFPPQSRFCAPALLTLFSIVGRTVMTRLALPKLLFLLSHAISRDGRHSAPPPVMPALKLGIFPRPLFFCKLSEGLAPLQQSGPSAWTFSRMDRVRKSKPGSLFSEQEISVYDFLLFCQIGVAPRLLSVKVLHSACQLSTSVSRET